MKKQNEEKRKLIASAFKGNIGAVKNTIANILEVCRGGRCFAYQNEDGTWIIIAPALVEIGIRKKIMTQIQFDEFLKKYDVEAWDLTHKNGDIRGKILNQHPFPKV
jgi:stage V sporulation protein SpoVS